MIDRLVHHAEILALKGDSYRLKDRDLTRPAPPATDRARTTRPHTIKNRKQGVSFQPGLDRRGPTLFAMR
jgi:hypothetical protein